MTHFSVRISKTMTKRKLSNTNQQPHLLPELLGHIIYWCDVNANSFRISKEWTAMIMAIPLERIKSLLIEQIRVQSTARFRLHLQNGYTTFNTAIIAITDNDPHAMLPLYMTSMKLRQLTRVSYDHSMTDESLRMKNVFLLLFTQPQHTLLSLSMYKHLLRRQSGKQIIGTTHHDYVCYDDSRSIGICNLYNTTLNLPRPVALGVKRLTSIRNSHLFLAHPRGIKELCDALNCLWRVTNTLNEFIVGKK